MRCPDCNKFVSLENADPEVDIDLSDNLDGTADISGSVRLVRACAECGTELKETSFELDEEVRVEPSDDPKHKHDLQVEESTEVTESGGGRYKKNEIGFCLSYAVICECGLKVEGTIEDGLAAGSWDEMT